MGLLIGSDLLLELANGVLVDIEASINCQYCAPRAAVFVAVLFDHPHRRRMDHHPATRWAVAGGPPPAN